MAERRKKSQLVAAVLTAAAKAVSEREIQERVKAPGASGAPNVRSIIRGLLVTGEMRVAGTRHTLDRGSETLFVSSATECTPRHGGAG